MPPEVGRHSHTAECCPLPERGLWSTPTTAPREAAYLLKKRTLRRLDGLSFDPGPKGTTLARIAAS